MNLVECRVHRPIPEIFDSSFLFSSTSECIRYWISVDLFIMHVDCRWMMIMKSFYFYYVLESHPLYIILCILCTLHVVYLSTTVYVHKSQGIGNWITTFAIKHTRVFLLIVDSRLLPLDSWFLTRDSRLLLMLCQSSIVNNSQKKNETHNNDQDNEDDDTMVMRVECRM